MSTVNTGWLKDNNGEKFAPKTLSSQIITNDGTSFESKLSSDLANIENNIISEFSKYETKTDAVTKLDEAKDYTNTAISNLINSAPTTLDTLGEIATAMEENADIVEALETAIGKKANASDLTSHTGNKSNPHGVTKSQVGLGNVENKSSATIRGEITKSNVTSALGYTPYTPTEVDSKLSGKANTSHNHDDRYYTESEVDSKLSDKADKSDVVQSDWNQNDETTADYIKNKPFSSNTNTILEEYLKLNDSKFTYISNGGYYKCLKYNAPSTTLRDSLLEKGIDIENMTPDDPRLKIKQLKVTIYSNSGEGFKVVTIDNPTYNIYQSGVNSKCIIFCDKTNTGEGSGMPIWGYEISTDNYEYYVVYPYFGSGVWEDYGVTSSKWGYNSSSKKWLGDYYSFEVVIESIKQIENKYLDVPRTLTVTTTQNRVRVENYNNILYSYCPPVANGSSTYGLVCPVKKTDEMTKEVGVNYGKLYTTPDIPFTPTTDDNGKFLRIVDGKIDMENYNPSSDDIPYDDTETQLGADNVQDAFNQLNEKLKSLSSKYNEILANQCAVQMITWGADD